MLFIFSQNIWFIYGVKGLRYLKQFMVIMILLTFVTETSLLYTVDFYISIDHLRGTINLCK